MTLDQDCIFCRIIRGEVPSFKVHEDERTLAFMDINPANPGHALVVPKIHAATLFDMPEDWLAATVRTAQTVARAINAALGPDGLSIVQANGPGAAQSVQHFHWHVLPRLQGDNLLLNWPLRPGSMDRIRDVAAEIRSRIAP